MCIKCFGENMSYVILCENCAAVCEKLGNQEKQAFYVQRAKEAKEMIG